MGKLYLSKLLEIAKAEVGYLEKATNSNLDDKTANAGSNNWTKYARDLYQAGYYNGNKNGYAWCDVFVDWLFYMASGQDPAYAQKVQCQSGPYGAACYWSASYYKNAGRLYFKDPKPGDQIFFGKCYDDATHTGIVYKVDNERVYTIEGNTSSGNDIVIPNGGAVAYKSYVLSNSNICGYGRPLYDEEEIEVTIDQVKTLVNQEVENAVTKLIESKLPSMIDTSVQSARKDFTQALNDLAACFRKDLSTISNPKKYKLLKEVTYSVYRNTLDKLIEAGKLNGKSGSGENLQIDLTEDAIRILVILDRSGMFDE